MLRHDVAEQEMYSSRHNGTPVATGRMQQLGREIDAMEASMAAMSRQLKGLQEETQAGRSSAAN